MAFVSCSHCVQFSTDDVIFGIRLAMLAEFLSGSGVLHAIQFRKIW